MGQAGQIQHLGTGLRGDDARALKGQLALLITGVSTSTATGSTRVPASYGMRGTPTVWRYWMFIALAPQTRFPSQQEQCILTDSTIACT
jgi:hypothetical protein